MINRWVGDVAGCVNLQVAGQRADGAIDHAVLPSAAERRVREHRPETDGDGEHDHARPPAVAQDVADGETDNNV